MRDDETREKNEEKGKKERKIKDRKEKNTMQQLQYSTKFTIGELDGEINSHWAKFSTVIEISCAKIYFIFFREIINGEIF